MMDKDNRTKAWYRDMKVKWRAYDVSKIEQYEAIEARVREKVERGEL